METLHLESELSLRNVEDTRIRISRLIEAPDARLVIDLSQVEIITTPGLGMLLHINNLARNSGSKFVLACPRPMVRDIFARTHLDRVLKLTDTIEEAKRWLLSKDPDCNADRTVRVG
jgi:anti-sigma B factor antagonist